jgi:hypothetical protein
MGVFCRYILLKLTNIGYFWNEYYYRGLQKLAI